MKIRLSSPWLTRAAWLATTFLAEASCGIAAPSTLVISITGLQPDITTLRLTARLAGAETVKEYAAAPTIGLQLPADASGQVELDLRGLGADGCPVASGQSSIEASQQARLDVTLQLSAQACSTNHLQLACSAGSCNGTCATGFNDCDGNKQANGCETQGACSLSFLPARNFAVADGAYSVAVGDFDRDAKPDIVVVSQTTDVVTLLLGDGQGGVNGASTYSVGANLAPRSLAIGDFTSDGKLDLAVADFGGHQVSILAGNDIGGFNLLAGAQVGTQPAWVAVADFDGDQKLDLAVSNNGSADLSILKGMGAGVFTLMKTVPAQGNNPTAIVTGDFDGDQKLDLAVSNNAGNVVVMLGDGSFGFPRQVPLTVGKSPLGLVAADFNGDRKLDLAVAIGAESSVSVLLGRGTGSFDAPISYLANKTPSPLVVGDFNGDQKLDLAVGNYGGSNISVLLGNGLGGFGAAAHFTVAAAPYSLAVADLNGDKKPDLVVSSQGSSVSVLLNSSQ